MKKHIKVHLYVDKLVYMNTIEWLSNKENITINIKFKQKWRHSHTSVAIVLQQAIKTQKDNKLKYRQ